MAAENSACQHRNQLHFEIYLQLFHNITDLLCVYQNFWAAVYLMSLYIMLHKPSVYRAYMADCVLFWGTSSLTGQAWVHGLRIRSVSIYCSRTVRALPESSLQGMQINAKMRFYKRSPFGNKTWLIFQINKSVIIV